jgi:hypothetical protein
MSASISSRVTDFSGRCVFGKGAAGADREGPPARGGGIVGAATFGSGRSEPLVASRRTASPLESAPPLRGPEEEDKGGPILGAVGRVPADDI